MRETDGAVSNRVRSFESLYIGGRWVTPSTEELIEVISPDTEQVIATVPQASEEDMDSAVASARKAFDEGVWPRMTPAARAEVLERVRVELTRRLPELEAVFTAEVGAPGPVSHHFHQFAVDIWQQAVHLHEEFVFEEERTFDGGHGTVVKEPIGVVAIIIPWNGPVTLASLKAAPALAAGCTVVIKPAPEAPLTTMILAEIFEAAGLPEGVVSILPAGREVGEHLVRHRDVDKITFTGSTAAGRRIMGLASERIARVTLELGGKSAAIIADDIPLDRVFPELVFYGIGHTGQVCAGLTRILVPR